MTDDNSVTVSKHFTMIDTRLVSREIPPNALSDMELKRYLHLCMYAHKQFGNTIAGHKDFKKYGRCSEKEFKKISERLQGMGFIQIKPVGVKGSVYTVNMLPFYDFDTKEFVSIINQPKTGFVFNQNRIHFIVVPSSAMRIALTLPRQEMLVLLKLYRYCCPSFNGGVDPNVLRVVGTEWFIHPKLPRDLYMTVDDFKLCVENLVNAGVFFTTNVGLMTEHFDVEDRYRITAGEDGTVFVPTYQWEGVFSDSYRIDGHESSAVQTDLYGA